MDAVEKQFEIRLIRQKHLAALDVSLAEPIARELDCGLHGKTQKDFRAVSISYE